MERYMKKLIIGTLAILILASCGKSNQVNTGKTPEIKGTSPYTNDFSKFEGNYDLITRGSDDCGASIQIVKDCEGLKLLSNNHLGAEEFCHINQGQIKDHIVTLEGNELKSVVTVSNNARISFTNTLTLNNDGTMSKISNLKSRASRCLYLKR